ncbi:hypothetical protein PMAYCL1PPCAC_21437 [Pristionchus mayeri]|uniref:F-box domain-containing protein n=1 Tax=Pristionchus mayeri TaxID=1317129 RepID=A0AAN5CVA4_9BILA|nr:hypothetical protein PMAYCL1PPCAC_21437 [Pristionchus mayeri]
MSLHSESRELPLSILEQLPKELLWDVVRRVPEATFTLRLVRLHFTLQYLRNLIAFHVSKAIKCAVDELALQQSPNQFLEELTLISYDQGFVCQVRIVLSNLSFLGCSLRGDAHKFRKRYYLYHSENSVSLSYKWKRDDIDLHNRSISFLRLFIGKQIKKALLLGSDFPNFSRLLEGVQVAHFDVFFDVLSDAAASRLNVFIGNRDLHQLTLGMRCFGITDPVRFLTELSQKFHALHIDQSKYYDSESTSHLLGMHPSGWVPVILDMFNNKMDKLLISTKNTNWNGAAFIDSIIQMLPRLEQRIWLEISSGFLDHEPIRNVHNDYVIQVTEPGIRQVLSIKHMSRVDEQFE